MKNTLLSLLCILSLASQPASAHAFMENVNKVELSTVVITAAAGAFGGIKLAHRFLKTENPDAESFVRKACKHVFPAFLGLPVSYVSLLILKKFTNTDE